MGNVVLGAFDWLGLAADDEGGRWSLPVGEGVISGASALFGGCATAAAVAIVQRQAPQRVLWASAHFGALAKLGSVVDLEARTISSGRTMTHAEVVGSSGDGATARESFTVRVAAGDRPDHEHGGTWVTPPAVDAAEASPPFDHPVHEGTWAARFDWRLAGSGTDAVGPWAAWWVRATEPSADAILRVAVLADYVTYGVGRALGSPMGGLSIDNVLRLHRLAAVDDHEWLLLEVRPEAIHGGFGSGTARIFAGGELAATGSQSMVMNGWDWRLPSERDGEP